MYKYSLLETNHMISSQGRYNHFDTAAYYIKHCVIITNKPGKIKSARTIYSRPQRI